MKESSVGGYRARGLGAKVVQDGSRWVTRPDSSCEDIDAKSVVIWDTEADNVDHWLHSPRRQEFFGPMGITGQLFTDPANSNRVGLILNVPDMEAFQKAMQSEEAADAMRFDGVRPETLLILEQASDHL